MSPSTRTEPVEAAVADTRAEPVEAPDGTRAEPVEAPRARHQAISYCPYCAEETLFPRETGWECRSCLRAFSVTFLGLTGSGITGRS